ncbi:hypothetical protein WDU94_001015 [Cyamophila willieti]
MLKIRTPRNLNEEMSSEGPTCSEASNPPSVDNITKPFVPLKASGTSMYIKSNDDFLLSIFEDDTTRPSSPNPEPTESSFKEPYPVARSVKKTNHQSHLLKEGSNAKENKNRTEDIILSTEEDYREDDISLHMEVEEQSDMPENPVMPENPPYKRRPYSGKPRRQRTRKEDVPLTERLRNRRVGKRLKEIQEKNRGDVIPDSEPWSEAEKLNFVTGLKEVGHFDIELLQTYVPTRSIAQVKNFFWCHKARHKAQRSYLKHKPNTSYIMRRASSHNLDVAVSFRRNRSDTATNLFSKGEYIDWWSCFLAEIELQTEPDYLRGRLDLIQRIHKRSALGQALFMIREFEDHPSVQETGGVDLKLAYHFLWACFTQQPTPPIDPTTRTFLMTQYDVLVKSALTNSKVLGFLDNFKRHIDDFTIKDPLQNLETEEETHFTFRSKDPSSPSHTPGSPSTYTEGEKVHSRDPQAWSGYRQRGWYSKYSSLKKRSYADTHFLFKHSLDDNELGNQTSPSSELLKSSVFNPLSIPMNILKK